MEFQIVIRGCGFQQRHYNQIVKVLYNNCGEGAIICNLNQAFRQSGALRPMPQLKVARRENTGGASKPLT